MVTTTMCQSGAALLKAGEKRDSDLATLSGASMANLYVDELIVQAESIINVTSRRNWTDDFAGLNADVKMILEDWCSNLAAMYLIEYNMNGYGSTRQAETMLDVLNNANVRNQSLLRDKKQETFIDNAT